MGLARHAGRSGTKIRDVRTLVFVAVLHGFKRFEKGLVRIMGLLRRAAKGSDGRPEGVCQGSRNPHVGGFVRNGPILLRFAAQWVHAQRTDSGVLTGSGCLRMAKKRWMSH